MDMADIKRLLEEQGTAWGEFKTATQDELAALQREFATFKTGAGAQSTEHSAALPTTVLREAKSGAPIPVFDHGHKLSALYKRESGAPAPNVGRMLRGMVLGGEADDAAELTSEMKALQVHVDPSGGFTVGGALSAAWIDALRAEMVLSRAGARTVPMSTNSLDIAVLANDPTAFWRSENATVVESEATFGRVSLQSKTVAAMVRMSIELAQDSTNIEAILERSLTQSLAHAIDKAGLVGETVNAGAAPVGIMRAPGRNKVTGIGAPANWDFVVDGAYELASRNIDPSRVTAMIAHPALWKKMAKLKTGIASDNTPLVVPADIAAIPKLYTTAAPLATGPLTATGIIGDFRELMFGVRQSITVRVLREAFMGSNLQVAVLAFARVDIVPAREVAFTTLEGILV